MYRLAQELYRDYPDPMPAFELLGGEQHGGALLDSALGEPRQTFGGHFLYRTIHDKAAALFRSLIKNHPFMDGNKRMALTSTEVFLLINHYIFFATQTERVEFALTVAASEPDIPWQEISQWMRKNSVRTTWLKMQLKEYRERKAVDLSNQKLRALINEQETLDKWIAAIERLILPSS